MGKFEQRAYIKIATSNKESITAIHNKLVNTYGSKAYSLRTVERWVASFKNGKSNLNDEFRSGRPVTACTNANIEFIEQIIDSNPHVSYRYLEEFTSMSRGTLIKIITDELHLSKRASRWIPHFLTQQNKQKRFAFAIAMLKELRSKRWRLDQILTGDECIFYHRKIHKQNESYTWKTPGESPDAIVKRDRYEPKTMLSIFFRTTDMVYVHAVRKGESIDNQYYIENCLGPAFETIKRQRPATGLRRIKFLHDGAQPHIHSNTRNFIESNAMIEIDHPPYSPDLAPCDYWLFDYIKSHLGDVHSSEELVESITAILKNLPKKQYEETFERYIQRLELCITAEGDYFEYLIK